MVVRIVRVNYLGVTVSAVTFVSLLLPWWSIRALGANIDIYPWGATAWNVWSQDWVIDRLLTLNSTLLLVGLLVFVSGVLGLVGSLKFPMLLISSFILNLAAAFTFFGLMRSAIGKLAFGPFSGTNLTAAGPWGFALGIGVCVIAGLVAPISLILSYLQRYRQ